MRIKKSGRRSSDRAAEGSNTGHTQHTQDTGSPANHHAHKGKEYKDLNIRPSKIYTNW